MSVDLTPDELGFKRPFNHEVTQVLKISNSNAGPVAFKVKTTAPKQYCVRPNSGIVMPRESVDVQVLLQAMKEDPPLDARCRDKFLVQSVQVDEVDEANIAILWSNVEKTNKSAIQEKKIRVQFLPPGADVPQANGISHEEQPPAYSSPTPIYGSPAPPSTSEKTAPSTAAENVKASASNAAEASGLAGVATAVANSVPTSSQQLQEQLNAAQARIKDLSAQLQDPQVRQRKIAEAQEKVQTVVQQSQETGVPLHIVAALCLVSFLVAYLFF